MEPSWLCFILKTHPDPIAFSPDGKSTISQVPFSTRVLYSSVAASLQRSDLSPCIAWLKVRGSGSETKYLQLDLPHHQTKWLVVQPLVLLHVWLSTIHQEAVRRGGSGAGGWTGGKTGSGGGGKLTGRSSGGGGSSGIGIGGRVTVMRSSTSPSLPQIE